MLQNHLSSTRVSVVFQNGTTLTLIGTAHVSKESVDEVKNALDEIKPDSVSIELDENRWDKIHSTDNNSFSSESLISVMKKGKTFLVLANLILASFQKKLNLNKEQTVGEEIVSAGEWAIQNNIPLTFADRDITITLQRAWRCASSKTKIKMASALLGAAFDKETITEEELTELKNSSNIEVMLNELSKQLPEVKETLIDERDKYLAHKIYASSGTNKFAVVGAGHLNGILKALESEENGNGCNIQEIEVVPKKKKISKVLSWLVPILLILVLVGIGFLKGWDKGLHAFIVWVVANAGSTLIFSILSLSHPLNWLVAPLCAPFAVINPFISIGVITGVVEASVKKMRVKDAENLADDVSLFKGWFKNRILHVFLVFIATSLGSVLGTFIFSPLLLSIWK